jgi:hypothetical protein
MRRSGEMALARFFLLAIYVLFFVTIKYPVKLVSLGVLRRSVWLESILLHSFDAEVRRSESSMQVLANYVQSSR